MNETSSVVLVAMVVYLVFVCVIGISGLVSYIFTSLSYYTIAQRRQISNPWLAWIPVGNYWIIGSIADDYDKRNGINRNWRKVLLTLALIIFSAFIVFYITFIVFCISMAVSTDFSSFTGAPPLEFISLIIFMYIGLFIAVIPSIALSACSYVCIYKVFESTVPEKSLKYFLLSLLVPFASVVCLWRCRNQGYSNLPEQNQ